MIRDLYSLVFEYYRRRNPGVEAIYARAICVLLVFCVCTNIEQVADIVFRLGIMAKTIGSSHGEGLISWAAVVVIGNLLMFAYVRMSKELQSLDWIRSHAANMSKARKLFVFGILLANVILLIILAQFRADNFRGL